MNFLKNLFSRKQKRQVNTEDVSWRFLEAEGAVSAEACPAISMGLTLIADSIASLPPKLMQVMPDGRKEPLMDHPVLPLLNNPNGWQTWANLVSWILRQVLLTGNGFVVFKDNQLIPVPSVNVSVRYYSTRLYYDIAYQYPYWSSETLPPDNVLHFKSGDTRESGVMGISPLQKSPIIMQLCQNQLQMALKATQVGVYPSAVIRIDDTNITDDEQERLYQQISQRYSAEKAFQKPLVISSKTDFTPVNVMSAREAQLVESRDQLVSEVARLLAIPESHLNRMQYSTLANFKESSRILLRYTLHPHIVRFQQTFSNSLLEPDVKLMLDQSEFVESKAERYSNLAVLVKHGIITAEQAKQIEGIA